MKDHVLELSQILWDYHRLNQAVEKSECIFTLCSHDLRVAVRSAELFLSGWAPLLIFSGDVGALTANLYDRPEAERFAEIALEMGVPKERILIENRATNTGENVSLTRDLLAAHGMDPASLILVQKPFMERRTYATFEKVWSGKRVCVTSPQIDFTEYPTAEFPLDRIIEIMVGDLHRIIEYPALGYQIPQLIPDDVLEAFHQLVTYGYDGHLIQGVKLACR